jgi:predicted transposase YbfD/YdcC
LLTQIKGNQKQLLTTIEQICRYSESFDEYEETETKHGRQEIRLTQTFAPNIAIYNLGYIYDNDWRKYIRTVIKVNRKTKVKYKGQIKNRRDTAYYVCTKSIPQAKKAAKYIRNHWHSENVNHYIRDTTLKEDQSRIRKNPGTMARIRSFALNLLKFKGEKNICKATYGNALDCESFIEFVCSIG